jgi:mannosyl-oligosaccharide alpha-1,2-mannosidase
VGRYISKGSPHEKLYMEVAAGVTKTCHHMYTEMASGIAPEFVNFQSRVMHAGARYNIQRPEAIEAIFYMFRKTGDPMYRDWAWEMFNSMVRGCTSSMQSTHHSLKAPGDPTLEAIK